nr:hypothetical protein [uncultured Carboxylicivirga sp.]
MNQMKKKELFKELLGYLTNEYLDSQDEFDNFMRKLTIMVDANYYNESGNTIVFYVLNNKLLSNERKLEVLKFAIENMFYDINHVEGGGLCILSSFLDFLLYEKQNDECFVAGSGVYLIIKFFMDQKVNLFHAYGIWDAPIQIARELGDETILELMGDNDEKE